MEGCVCEVCNKVLKHVRSLNQHMKMHGPLEELFACTQCDRNFRLETSLKRHFMRNHLVEKPFECSQCKKGFSFQCDLSRHVLTHSTSDNTFVCSHCNARLKSADSLCQHLEIHTRQTLHSCGVCCKKFRSEKYLSFHVRTKHTDDGKKYSCDLCPKTYSRRREYDTHMKHHTGEKPYSCDVCKKFFLHKCSLNKHILLNHGTELTMYSCMVCDKTFKHKDSLTKHSQMVHEENVLPKFSCSVCNKEFKYRDSLLEHMRRHTGDAKWFCCLLCSKKFSREIKLEEHMSVHTGEKLFSCGQCNKSFCGRSSLKRHARTHEAEPLYSYTVEIGSTANCDEQSGGKTLSGGSEGPRMRTAASRLRLPRESSPNLETTAKSTNSAKHTKTQTVSNSMIEDSEKIRLESTSGIAGFEMNRCSAGNKNFCCNICDRKFNLDADLKEHLQKCRDRDEKPYVCYECRSSFTKAVDMRDHVREFHSVEIRDDSTFGGDSKETRPEGKEESTMDRMEDDPNCDCVFCQNKFWSCQHNCFILISTSFCVDTWHQFLYLA